MSEQVTDLYHIDLDNREPSSTIEVYDWDSQPDDLLSLNNNDNPDIEDVSVEWDVSLSTAYEVVCDFTVTENNPGFNIYAVMDSASEQIEYIELEGQSDTNNKGYYSNLDTGQPYISDNHNYDRPILQPEYSEENDTNQLEQIQAELAQLAENSSLNQIITRIQADTNIFDANAQIAQQWYIQHLAACMGNDGHGGYMNNIFSTFDSTSPISVSEDKSSTTSSSNHSHDHSDHSHSHSIGGGFAGISEGPQIYGGISNAYNPGYVYEDSHSHCICGGDIQSSSTCNKCGRKWGMIRDPHTMIKIVKAEQSRRKKAA